VGRRHRLKELVVVSGKGGTGKTSVAASFAALAGSKVVADCDVDAADLHLVLAPVVARSEPFVGGSKARIDAAACAGCGKCEDVCRFDAIHVIDEGCGEVAPARGVDSLACEGCGACEIVCPEGAAVLEEVVSGELFVSESRTGPFVHARLGIAEENSGKLVTRVRAEARKLAQKRGLGLVIVDASPGIGCPVIASLTGASLALVVTEPTLSGFHDMQRVGEVAASLRTPVAVCVNKCDLNPEVADSIEDWCAGRNLPLVGRIPYDGEVSAAQVHGLSVVEYSKGPAAQAIRNVWSAVARTLGVKEGRSDRDG
jgi:MinD superfamily P-loop ATPase